MNNTENKAMTKFKIPLEAKNVIGDGAVLSSGKLLAPFGSMAGRGERLLGMPTGREKHKSVDEDRKMKGFWTAPWLSRSEKHRALLVKFTEDLERIDDSRYAIKGVDGGRDLLLAAADLIPSTPEEVSLFVQEIVRPLVSFLFKGDELLLTPEMLGGEESRISVQGVCHFLREVVWDRSGYLAEHFDCLVMEAVSPLPSKTGGLRRARFLTTFIFDEIDAYLKRRTAAAFLSTQERSLREIEGQTYYASLREIDAQVRDALEMQNYSLAKSLAMRAEELTNEKSEVGDPRVTVGQVVEEIQEILCQLGDAIREFGISPAQYVLLS